MTAMLTSLPTVQDRFAVMIQSSSQLDSVDTGIAVNARSVYVNQATATWYQIDVQSVDSSASFTSFQETTSTTTIPPPDDLKQTQGPAPWNVDHIFELQVIGEMCKSSRP